MMMWLFVLLAVRVVVVVVTSHTLKNQPPIALSLSRSLSTKYFLFSKKKSFFCFWTIEKSAHGATLLIYCRRLKFDSVFIICYDDDDMVMVIHPRCCCSNNILFFSSFLKKMNSFQIHSFFCELIILRKWAKQPASQPNTNQFPKKTTTTTNGGIWRKITKQKPKKKKKKENQNFRFLFIFKN